MATILKGKTFINRFDPSLVSGLQLWLDASDSTTLFQDSAATTPAVADGDPVGCWKDKSGYARNATQTDGTKKPLLKTNVQNSRNVIKADGVNDWLTTSPNSVVTAQPFQYFLAMNFVSTNTNDRLIAGANDYGNLEGSGNDWSAWCGNHMTVYNRTTNPIVVCVGYNSTSSFFRLNKVQSLNGSTGDNLFGNVGTGVPTTLGIFGRSDNNGPADAIIYEILIFSNILSSANTNVLENHLMNKWGIV